MIGLGVGIMVAALNGFITDLFSSPHYLTATDSDKFIFGITLGYGVSFLVISLLLIRTKKPGRIMLIYPVTGLVAVFIAVLFRSIGAGLPSLDCGDSCVDTQAPLSVQNTATTIVTVVLIVIYVACTAYSLLMKKFRSRKA